MIPIYSAADIKAIEQAALKTEDIKSDELMERAAKAFIKKFMKLSLKARNVMIFCGFGNNGGDGIAIARLLHKKGYNVSVYVLQNSAYSNDWQINYERLLSLPVNTYFISDSGDIEELEHPGHDAVIIDALWGYGLSRPISGVGAQLVNYINALDAIKIAVDIPSGIGADSAVDGPHVIVDYTITFEWKKQIMYLGTEAQACGEIIVAPLDFLPESIAQVPADNFETRNEDFKAIVKPRNRFSQKRDYGHACIIGGSKSMAGAVALCSKACVTAGAGLTTALTANACLTSILAHSPETMTLDGGVDFVEQISAPAACKVVAAGPGLGRNMLTALALKHALINYANLPWVIDADALNIIAEGNLQGTIPKDSILTPHAGEFDRLFGKHNHDIDRITTAISRAKELQSTIIVKGHHTAVVSAHGRVYFNTSGNAGLAKGGSGDVLTGILAALRAQKYNALETALLGVYLHGLSADLAANELTTYCVTASQLINYLPHAFKAII